MKPVNPELVLHHSTLSLLATVADSYIASSKSKSKTAKQDTSIENLLWINGLPPEERLAAVALLSKLLASKIYPVRLSSIMSKYIGETEKNLNRLFKKVNGKAYILFFDEADALFGKRTTVKDAHDRYANQEVSYLLERLKTLPLMVIIASEKKWKPLVATKKKFPFII